MLARTSRRVIMVFAEVDEGEARLTSTALRQGGENVTSCGTTKVSAVLGDDGVTGVAPRNCADRRELGRRMHRCISLHRGFAEYHVRACIGSDGNGPHRDDIASCNLRSSGFCRGRSFGRNMVVT